MLRVAFVLRSTEVIPVFSDLFTHAPAFLFEKTIIEKFKGNDDFEVEKIDKNSVILRTSLDNALNTLRKMNLNESGLKHITKQSNLVRYFNA